MRTNISSRVCTSSIRRPEAGALGRTAADALGVMFDSRASKLILDGSVRLPASLVDVHLGVLPLLPLALHLWMHFHSPTGVATSSPLLAEAEKMVLTGSGTSPNFHGARPFLHLFAVTQALEELFNREAVFAAIVRAVNKASHLHYSTGPFSRTRAHHWQNFARDISGVGIPGGPG